MEVVVGGNRLGSGNKMHARMHNYYRSTHNLTEKFTSSAGVGILYPYMCKLMMRGDRFDINTEADARTIPAKGALFGSFKLQIDAFFCPVRLYVGLLHNNPRGIGLKMNQVKWPTMTILSAGESNGTLYKKIGFSNNCLWKYLGLSGLGNSKKTESQLVSRTVEAIPLLAYYDIYKNYYANKQEDVGYYIRGNSTTKSTLQVTEIKYNDYDSDYIYKPGVRKPYDTNNIRLGLCDITQWNNTDTPWQIKVTFQGLKDTGKEYLETYTPSVIEVDNYKIWVWKYPQFQYEEMTIGDFKTYMNSGECDYDVMTGVLTIYTTSDSGYMEIITPQTTIKVAGFSIPENQSIKAGTELKLQSFPLQNLDDMRYNLLSYHTLGSAYSVSSSGVLPYITNSQYDAAGTTYNKFPLNGLAIKTYQNDIFNNWLNTAWIEGQNGIADITAVQVTNGEFSIDALSFKEKLYNLLNRIAIAGNTYEDWQDVVYEEKPKMHMETPIFVGGMSKEIIFDEVIQTSQTNENKALGTMGGRGRASGGKGGHYVVKADEAGFLIGIVSITPRINYNQCNEFYLTEIQSMDDLHKPGMDGIGFQDLIGERMAYFDTNLDGQTPIKHKIGKLPAWIEYMTSVDRTFGDFAYSGDNEDIPSYMVLNRNYELNENLGQIKDATTYIDPAKYNYAFAYSALDSQNFWIQIKSHIEARRKMSARIIPNV